MGFFDSVGSALSSIDPSKTVSDALVGVDKGVQNLGGWQVVGPAAAAAIAAPYVLPELMGSSAGGFGLNAAGTGGTFGSISAPAAGYTFGELTAPSLASIQSAAGLGLGGTATAGLTAAQKALLLRSGFNSLGQIAGGSGTQGMSSGGYGSSGAGGYNYANMPYLANPQSNQTYMKTGQDVSGTGTTTAGMPVQLDTTRHNILMANLLRG